MRIENDIKLDFNDVLIRPKRSTLGSRKDVILERYFKFLYSSQTWQGIPIIASNMDTSGTIEMHQVLSRHSLMVALHKHYPAQTIINYINSCSEKNLDNMFLSIGISDKDIKKLIKIATETDHKVKKLMVDVANGYSEKFIETISWLRNNNMFSNYIIAGGNVVTADMAEAIVLAGADIVKCGIGNGSVCSTRIQTGIGYPQLSAVIECADAVHGLGGHLISDGGCNEPGDFAKACGGGADVIMSGSYFAGHEESGGNIVEKNGTKLIEYYGMSSNTAQERHNDGLKEYRSSEGRTTLIPYKGKVHDSVMSLLGGLRSSCTYVGALSIKELPKRTTFVRVHQTHNKTFENNTIRR